MVKAGVVPIGRRGTFANLLSVMPQYRAKSTTDRAESTAHRAMPVADDSEGSTADSSDDPLSGTATVPRYIYDQDGGIIDAAIGLVKHETWI